jgi:hypothetical protein
MNLEDLLEMLMVSGSYVEQIDAAVLAHNEAKQIMAQQNKPYKAVQDQAKTRIGQIIESTGQQNWNASLQNGYAYVSASYPKVTYDVDILDRYLATCDDPTVRAILQLARKETMVKGSLTIK